MTKKRKQKQVVDNNQAIEEEPPIGLSQNNSKESIKSIIRLNDPSQTKTAESVDDLIQALPKKKKKKTEAETSNGDLLNNDEPVVVPTVEIVKQKKKKKIKDEVELQEECTIEESKKRKNKGDASVTDDSQDSENGMLVQPVKVKKIKIKQPECEQTSGEGTEIGIEYPSASKKVSKKQDFNEIEYSDLPWPEEDITELINRMEQCIPPDDHFSYKTRLMKIEWEQVTFNDYTIEDCQKTWAKLERNVRSYRLLKEMLNDARHVVTCINNTPIPAITTKHQVHHPDMPRRPLTAYFLFYVKKKAKIQKENPGIDGVELTKTIGQMFKNLPPEKKEKYELQAAKEKEEYRIKLEEFYKNHPDLPTTKQPKGSKGMKGIKAVKSKRVKERAPKRPDPPFKMFFKSELSKSDIPEAQAAAFRDTCREKWRQMTDKQKLPWINYAEEEYAKYEETLKKYMQQYPDYVHVEEKRSFLSRDEVSIKERLAGKPDKPPVSAYAVYAKLVFNKDELKGIPAKDRLNFISNKWKLLSDQEKLNIKNLHSQMVSQYNKDFMRYIASLPEDKRKIEMQSFSGKKSTADDESSKKQKAKPVEVKKFEEPEQPPISPFKYFASLYKGEEPVAQVWKALSVEEKQKYEQDLVQKKQQYILEFERFLKSLTKDELETFSNLRKQKIEMKQNPVEASTESDSDSSDADSSEEDEDDEDDSD